MWVPVWLAWPLGAFDLFGVCAVLYVAGAGLERVGDWWRFRGDVGDDYTEGEARDAERWTGCACCGIYPARSGEITCEDCAGWEEHALDHEMIDHGRSDAPPSLPPERSREELGFTGPQPAMRDTMADKPGGYLTHPAIEAAFNDLYRPHRERWAPAWEAEARSAYQALDLDYPSGLLARVREAGQ